MTENERNLMDEELDETEQAAPAESELAEAPAEAAAEEAVIDGEAAAEGEEAAEAGAAADAEEAAVGEEAEAAEGAEAAEDLQTVSKLNTKKVILAVLAVVLVAALVGVGGFFGVRYLKQKRLEKDFVSFQSEEGAVTAQPYTSYAYEDAEQAPKYLDKIVARMGERELDNAQLQIFFWSQYYGFMNSYGSYASIYGLDSTQPLADQMTMDGSMNWEQSFLTDSLELYRQYTALVEEAEAQGFTLTQEEEDYIASLPETMAEQVTMYGYESLDHYMTECFGPGVTVEDYEIFTRSYATSMAYASEIHAGISCTDEEIEAYYDTNAESYAANGVTRLDKPVVNVRHILIQPEMDQDTDDDGTMDTSSDEAWAAAREQAEELLAQWEEDPTEDNFATLADEHSSDSGSNTNGGLYEDVYPGQMVEAFNDWCFADERAVGDSGIVETNYGYHIMFYSGTGDTIYWRQVAEEDCITARFDEALSAIIESRTLEVNYHNIHIYDVISVANKAAIEAASAAAEEEAAANEAAAAEEEAAEAEDAATE